MCGAKNLKSIKSSLMLISSCCDDHLFNTFLSGFCPVFTSSSVDQDAFAATVWNIPRDVPVTPPF